MIWFIKFLLVGLPAFSSVVQADCRTKEIQHKDVLSCICQDHQKGCKPSAPFYCLKGKPCDASGTVIQNGPMVWVYLPGGDEPLITTSDPLPGILEMANHPTIYKDAFNFAQDPKHFEPDHRALVLNSVRSRTMEQFHIHKCFRPTTGSPRALARLDKAPLNPTKKLIEILPRKPLEPRIWCMGVAKNKGPVTDFVEAIEELLHRGGKDPICPGLAGAAVIQDNNGRRWGCVTDNREGPLPYFCAGHSH
ncbi:hypothetical protein MKX08_000756 [Trichoderma sp. CBMAI-0020]|nr:hypothetical protein MKX08_000756 [Trichoderma sp. CBMAI-0020]